MKQRAPPGVLFVELPLFLVAFAQPRLQRVMRRRLRDNRVPMRENGLVFADLRPQFPQPRHKPRRVALALLPLLLFFPELRLFHEQFGLPLLQRRALAFPRVNLAVRRFDALRQPVEFALVFGLMREFRVNDFQPLFQNFLRKFRLALMRFR